MTWEPRPTPDVNPETEPFWEAAADEQFLLQECDDCGLVYYYPRAFCPDCFGENVSWIEAEGTGTVYSYSVSEQVAGWPEEKLPLVVAYVELAEGPRVMTNLIDCDPEDVAVGDEVEVRFEPAEDGDIAIPVFEPV